MLEPLAANDARWMETFAESAAESGWRAPRISPDHPDWQSWMGHIGVGWLDGVRGAARGPSSPMVWIWDSSPWRPSSPMESTFQSHGVDIWSIHQLLAVAWQRAC